VIEKFVCRLWVDSVSGRVFGAKFTMGGHILRPVLRKFCECKFFIMVWVEENSTARWLEKVVIEEFVCRLWVDSVSGRVFGAKFTMGGHIWRPVLRKVCECKLFIMVWVEENSTARWLEKVVIEEFVSRLWVESVRCRVFRAKFTMV